MIFLKMKRNLKLKKKKKERKINMKSSGKRKVNWTPQILMGLLRCKRKAQVEMKWNKQTRGLPNVMFRKWKEMGYEHLQMQFFVQNLSDRVAKAEGGSKTLRDHMKKQHMLSEIAENNNHVQESEPGRENAKESTTIEDERYFTNQESQSTGEQNRTMPRTPRLSTTEEYNGQSEIHLTLFNKAMKVYSEMYDDRWDLNKRQW